MTDRMDKIKESGLNEGWENDYVCPDPIRSYLATLIISDPLHPPPQSSLIGDPGYEKYAINETTIGVSPKWIRVSEKLPPISYLESDNEDDPHEAYPVLVFSDEEPGIFSVAYLVKEQNEDRWHFGDLSWELYIPNGGGVDEVDFDVFSHWMPLPNPPVINES